MLNENSTRNHDNEPLDIPEPPPPLESTPREIRGLRDAINEIMLVQRVAYPNMPQIVGQYAGQLTMSSAEAFDYIEPTFQKLGVHGYFTINDAGEHQITVLQGRFNPKPRPWWPNLVLLMLTILSLLWVGGAIQASINEREINDIVDVRLWEGWPYALSLMLILGAHELGHYFAARHHKVSVTLPYFIPLPFIGIFGTLGAFIQLREPMRNRRILFDIGVAGPLAGLIFAIPILFIGLATSDVKVIPTNEDTIREGNSIFYIASKYVVFGRYLPDEDKNEDVFINQLAQAGWTGLFITALNLIPLGQLDGGHVTYTLFGQQVMRLYWPVIITFAILTTINSAWLLWTILLFLLGRFHARPLEDITPLDTRRRLIGYVAIVLFVLLFIPNPIQFISAQ